MGDITVKDLKKAIGLLKKSKAVPTKILMNPVMEYKVIKMLNEQGIETMGADGNHYVLGMRVITDIMCDPDIAYIK